MDLFHQPWELIPSHVRGKGGREIGRFRGAPAAVDCADGSECWVGAVNTVQAPPADQPYKGCSQVILPDGQVLYLFQAIAMAPQEVLGEKHIAQYGTGLGVLVKFLDAQVQYRLQCHPTRPWAKKMWNSDFGKEESWYIISTREDTREPAYILLGFKEGITPELWEKYYRKDDTAALENLCHKIPVKPGDAFFVGGGCPHAVGAGCLLIEVQEPSDLTLGARPFYAETIRDDDVPEDVFDRRLLGAYIYEGRSYADNLKKWASKKTCFRKGPWGEEIILIGPDHTQYFSVTRLSVHGEAAFYHTGYPQIAIVESGKGTLIWDGGSMEVSQAKELFFPVDIPNFRVVGDVDFVLSNPGGVSFS